MAEQVNILEQLKASGLTLEQIVAAGKAASDLHKAEVQKAVEGEKAQRQTVSNDVAEMVGEIELAAAWDKMEFTFVAKRSDTGLDDGSLVVKCPDSVMDSIWEVLDTAGARELKSLKRLEVTFKAGQKGTVTLQTSGVAKAAGGTGTAGVRGWTREGGSPEKLDDIFQENATDAQKDEYKAKVQAKDGNKAYIIKIKVAVDAGYSKVK